MEKCFVIDTTKCTACRGCQVACKQWHKLPAEKTVNVGSHQNPQDLSFITYKLVRFSEHMEGDKPQWLFFPEQCRHCILAPCKETADVYVEGAILRDEETQAVLFTAKLAQLSPEERQEVRDNCPYDIPRIDPESGLMSKCDMCIDRVHNGLLPACVAVCPTGAMNFGDREDMVKLAQERLAAAKKRYPKASIIDADDVNVLYIVSDKPEKYFDKAQADASHGRGITRKEMFARIFNPVKTLGKLA